MTTARGGASLFSAIVLLLIPLLGACASGRQVASERTPINGGNLVAAVTPPHGLIYSKLRAPAFAEVPGSVGPRTGRATVHQIALPPIHGISPALPLVAWGDASKEEAARQAGLESVSHVDYELTTILMVYRRFTLLVYGE